MGLKNLFGRRNNEATNWATEKPVDKELAFAYKKLCKLSSENIAETLSVMSKVHTDEFMANLAESAKKDSNFLLAWVITDARIAQWSEEAEERKKKLQAKYDKLFIDLYISSHSCSLYDMREWFNLLQQECVREWDFVLAEKCHKVLNDLETKWDDLQYNSRIAYLEGRHRWKDYWPSNYGPEDYWQHIR